MASIASDAQQGVTLLLGLMAAQFLVHAAGWSMAAAMQRQVRGTEAHFAGFWLALAAALGLYLGPWPREHVLRVLADAIVIASLMLVHRGVLRFYRQPLPDRVYLGVVVLTLLLLGATRWQADGHRLRLVWVSLMVGSGCLALGWAFWRHEARGARIFAAAVALTLASTALAFLVRAVLAAVSPDPVALAIGAPTSLSMAYAFVIFFVGGLFNLAQIRLVLGRVFQQLLAQSHMDALTGVANRRGFMAALHAVHQRAQRGGLPYALLMVDIDHFKRINDSHGHAAGDTALRRVAQTLAAHVRSGDTLGRLGGEEFCLLLARCDRAVAEGLAQRVCEAVADGKALTVSVGVALVDAVGEDIDQALRRADAALYRAKDAGRNCVRVAAA